MSGSSGNSITMDINARITGWQNSIKDFQKAMGNIDPSSSIGKSLGRMLEEYKRKVASMSKDSTPSFYSEGELQKFMTALEKIDSLGVSIGQTLSGVSIKDINLDSIRQQTDQLQASIEATQQHLTQLKGMKLSDLLSKGDFAEFSSTLESLGLNIQTLSVSAAGTKLGNMFQSATNEVQGYEEKLRQAQQTLADLQQQQSEMKTPAIVEKGGGLDGLLEGLKPSEERAQQVADTLIQNITEATKGLGDNPALQQAAEDLKNRIRTAFTLDDKGQLASDFEQQITEIFSIATGKTGRSLHLNKSKLLGDALGFNRNTSARQMSNFILGDTERTYNRLMELISPEATKKELDEITTAYSSGDLDKLAEIIKQIYERAKKAAEEGQASLASKIEEASENATEISGSLEKAKEKRETVRSASAQFATMTSSHQQEITTTQQSLNDQKRQLANAAQPIQQEVQSIGVNQVEQLNKNLEETEKDANKAKNELQGMSKQTQTLNSMSGFVQRWFGAYALINKATSAIRNMIGEVKELDKTITAIAVVTNMSQSDLWDKIGEYTNMAQQYGVATKDVYTVSQIFYQQGLQTAQVMSLTAETLKMAKIAGIDYSSAANAMTVAVRAFKIEMTDAQQVTDTYSALAAKFAVSSAEIANAMEKTASSAASVGMTLQSTSAFISVMEQTTRESAQNIGSALKSIISRYGEMKASPDSLMNVEGEEVSYNKTDEALKSVGISIKDASGQFRNFDDVIMELAQKWNTLDKNTQRYIATVMAGNRQQSRFIALVSNYEELSRAMDTANNSENASIVQVAKTMDSLETKTQQLKNAWSQLYLSFHIEDALKGVYDFFTNILKTVGKLGVLKGLLPSLMSIFGFGKGLKSGVQYLSKAMDRIRELRNNKKQVDVNTDKALKKVEELNNKAAEPITKEVHVKTDDQTLPNTASQALADNAGNKGALVGMLRMTGMSDEDANTALVNGLGKLGDESGRKSFMESLDIDTETSFGGIMDEMLADFSAATSTFSENLNDATGPVRTLGMGLTDLESSAGRAATSNLEAANAAVRSAQAEAAEAQASYDAAQAAAAHALANRQGDAELLADKAITARARLEEANAAVASAQAKQQEASTAYGVAQSNEVLANSNRISANSEYNKKNANDAEAQASLKAAAADEAEANSSSKAAGAKGAGAGGQGKSASEKWATGLGIGAMVANIAGPIIAAVGASTKDKSSDKHEKSKILTGIGNGFSMAGTGAMALSALGPWGMAAGAIGGFLIGGLGAILDGLEVKLSEQIDMLRDETEEAKNESLKKQAKVTGLDSSIENLKALQKVMYNSEEDMKNYKDAMAAMAEEYPSLIGSYDEAGNAIIDLQKAEEALAQARLDGARSARQAIEKELQLRQKEREALLKARGAIDKQEKAGNGNIGTGVISTYGASYTTRAVQNDGRVQYVISSKRDRDQTNQILYDQALLDAYMQKHPEESETRDYDEQPLTWDEIIKTIEFIESDAYEAPSSGQSAKDIDWTKYKEDVLRMNDLGAEPVEWSYSLDQINSILHEFPDLFDNANDIYDLLKKPNKTEKISESDIKQAKKIVEGKLAENQQLMDALSLQDDIVISQIALYENANLSSSLSTDQRARLQKNNSYSSLFKHVLQNGAYNNEDYDSVSEWAQKAPEEYNDTIGKWSNEFIAWYSKLTDSQKTLLENLNFTEYTNVEDIITKLGLTGDETEYIKPALEAQWKESIATQKKKVLELIWTDIDKGILNDQALKSLMQNNSDQVKEIGQLFQNDQIISKYGDFVKDELLKINGLAENGYENVAQHRLNILTQLLDGLSNFTSTQQNELFGIISNVDLSDYASVVKGKRAVEEYGKKNKVDVKGITDLFDQSIRDLVVNTNTLANELAKEAGESAKKVDSLLSSAKSGFSFDKAIEAFEQLSAAGSKLSFDETFDFDAKLQKWVYTPEGLAKAMEQYDKNIADRQEHIEQSTKLYNDYAKKFGIQDNGKIGVQRTAWAKVAGKWTKEQAYQIFEISDEDKSKYDDLFTAFGNEVDQSWAHFIEFVEQYYADGLKGLNLSEEILNNLKANKKNQYYAAIDWDALATGTDFTGANQQYIDQLAKELGMEEGYTWQSVREKYLEQAYADAPEEAKAAAQAAAVNSTTQARSKQVATAITEVLAGTETAYSEPTVVLMQQVQQAQTAEQAAATATANYVDTAITLYETAKDGLLNNAERNKAYTEILTKKYEDNNAIVEGLSNGASLGIDGLNNLFTALDIELAQVFDARTGTWKEGLENAVETDAFGKTKITNWDVFKSVLTKTYGVDFSSIEDTFEYRNAYSSYVDGLIEDATANTEYLNKSANNLFSQIEPFAQLNVSAFELEEGAELSGATLENGILTITDAVEYAHWASDFILNLSTIKDEKQLYEQYGWTKQDLAKNWKTAQEVINRAQTAWTGISDNILNLSDSDIANLAENGGLNLNDLSESFFIKVGDAYILKLDAYQDYLTNKIVGPNGKATPEQQHEIDEAMNNATSAVIAKISQLNWDSIIDGSATDLEQQEFYDGLNASLSAIGISINDVLDKGILDPSALRQQLTGAVNKGIISQNTADTIYNSVATSIAEAQDAALNAFNSNLQLGISGTNSVAEMEKFTQRYNKISSDTLLRSTNDLFYYDDLLQSYVIRDNMLQLYIDSEREQLEKLGYSNEYITKYLQSQAQQLIGQEIDIVGFITGSDISNEGKAAQTLIRQLKKWALIAQEEFNTDIIKTLLNGGQDAVDQLIKIKGAENVSSDEIEAVYRARVNRLQTAAEQLAEVTVGSIISGDLVRIFDKLTEKGFQIKKLGDGTAVVEAVGNMVEAYAMIYKSMEDAAIATTAELNDAYADLLTAIDQKNIDAIDALGNADGMDYKTLGQLLANYGIKLEDVIADAVGYGLESLGNGKIRIKDWKTFSSKVPGLGNTSNEAVLDAFNSYNDSLIELDRKVGKKITEEIKAIGEAKAGDKINVTYLTETLGMAENEIQAWLFGTGATIENGILTISEGANIPTIVTQLAMLAKDKNKLISSELAELADSVSSFLQKLVDLINNGLAGTLSNVDANSLKDWASSQGINLDFTQTAEGLKLSQESAIQLYTALKNVDNIKSKLVFDELNNSLKETNTHYKSASSILTRIAQLNKLIDDTLKNINEKNQEVSLKKIEQYQQELDLAKEILAVRSTTEDDSFNFMSGDIPGGQKNPLNYAKNWGQAVQLFQDVFSKSAGSQRGMIDYQDWYNIVNEINNLAGITGRDIKFGAFTLNGELTSAANAIEAGCNALTAVDTGEVKVDLTKIGFGIKTGAEAMNGGVEAGIHDLANAQVKMLDGLISMLELIVQMQELGDLDIDGNGIELSELFTFDTEKDAIVFQESYEKWRQRMIDQLKLSEGDEGFNKDLQNALKGIKIGSLSLADIINWDETQLKNADELTQQTYLAVLSAFSEAAKSGDYDLDNIGQSVIDILRQNGFSGQIQLDVGDISYIISGESMVTIDWQSVSTKTIIEAYNKATGDNTTIQDAQTILQKYTSGQTLSNAELTYALMLTESITLVNGKVSITIDGKTYTGNSENLDDVASQAIANAAFLKERGFEVTQEEMDETMSSRTGTITHTETLESGYEYKVKKSTEENDKYIDSKGNEHTSLSDMQAAEEKYYLEDKELNFGEGVTLKEGLTKQQFRFQLFGETAKIEYAFSKEGVKDSKKVTQEAMSDPKLKQQALNLVQGGQDAINELITEESNNGDGTFTVQLGEYKYTFAAGSEEEAKAALMKQVGDIAGIDINLSNTITFGIQNAFKGLSETLANVDSSALDGVAAALTTMLTDLQALEIINYAAIAQGIASLSSGSSDANGSGNLTVPALPDLSLDADIEPAREKIAKLINEVAEALATMNITADVTKVQQALKDNQTVAGRTPVRQNINVGTNSVLTTIYSNRAEGLRNPVKQDIQKGAGNNASPQATGNVGLATGNAMAGGSTLMGELGPELVVSGGRYFVVGQNGPEMVNLAEDAIVFNHLQTASLLAHGTANSRGRAVTNERKATSLATGNIKGGPAMASAADALASLKQLRAMWKQLASLSIGDLGKKAGGGGGGGGDLGSFIADLDRWYTLMQKIAALEKQINYEEKLRTKILSDREINGNAYYESQKRSLAAIKSQASYEQQLADLQQDYLDHKVKDLENSFFGKIMRMDEESGMLIFNDEATMANGDHGGLRALGKLYERDEYGKPTYNVKEQVALLKAWGMDMNEIMYDTSGKKIDTSKEGGYEAIMKNFDDWMNERKEEIDQLNDEVKEHRETIIDLDDKRNKILQEIIDNQRAVEDRVLKAVENIRQQEIDQAQDERDAIEDSTGKFLDGLSEQLDRERDMYETNDTQSETERMRRQLAILQRSGGSAAEIKSLQDEIAQRDQDAYFDAQQRTIDAIQSASDKQIERLDHQIDLMTKALAYDKEHGLLWAEVYKVINASTPEQLVNYINANTPENMSMSELAQLEETRKMSGEIEQYFAYAKDAKMQEETDYNWEVFWNGIKGMPGASEHENEIRQAYVRGYKTTDDPNKAGAAANEAMKVLMPKPEKPAEDNSLEPEQIDTGSTGGTKASGVGYVILEHKTTTGKTLGTDNLTIKVGSKVVTANHKRSFAGYTFSTATPAEITITEAGQTIKGTLQYAGYIVQYYGGEGSNPSALRSVQVGASSPEEAIKKAKLPKGATGIKAYAYSQGGLADYTGLAMVHGSKSKPEAFLNAEETQLWKNQILSSGGSNSLANLLLDFRNVLNNQPDYSSIGTSTDFGGITLNMNVASIANDYDVRQAADTAMDEILKIARKTSVNSIRR